MPNNPTSDQLPIWVTLLSNFAAGTVVVLSIAIAFSLLYTLHVQVITIENSANITDLTGFIQSQANEAKLSPKQIELFGQLLMESDAQFLRTERAQSLLGARLLVNIAAELVGLTLVVLGGALIFARIRGNSQFKLVTDVESTKPFRIELLSNFPGLFLCMLGTVLVIWTLQTTVHENAKLKTTDAALFFPPSQGNTAIAFIRRMYGNSENSTSRFSSDIEDQKVEESCLIHKSQEFCSGLGGEAN